MASDDPRKQYQAELDTLRRFTDEGRVTTADADAIREFLRAKDGGDMAVTDPEGETLEPSSLAAYGQGLRLVASRHDTPLIDTDADELNEFMQSCRDGDAPGVKDSGLSVNTLGQQQSALRKFYRFHDHLGVTPEDIIILRAERTPVDERDLFSREEIEAMRDVIDNPRDRCLFELLVYTGQRIRAIQTLRVKDVDTTEAEGGVFYLNTDEDGLKGATKNGMKRPLLGAKRAVYDWLQYHPTGDPEDYLITVRPSANRGEPGSTLHQTTIGRILKGIAKDAGVKGGPDRVNPHLFRHYFVTVAKREYGLDNDTIKRLIGHGPGSKVMETTYAHLTDEDYIEKAEVGAGLREPDDDESLTPNICPTCDENLSPGAKACPACGTVFAPDAKAVKDQVDEDVWDSKGEASGKDENAVNKLKDLLYEYPELYEELTDRAE